MKYFTLEKAAQLVQVDEATSIQETQFSALVNKAAAPTYKQEKETKHSKQHSSLKDNTPRRCKFCMKFHNLRKDLRPAKDSICKSSINPSFPSVDICCGRI